jgi:membrane-bound lytic murein transglycosylase A
MKKIFFFSLALLFLSSCLFSKKIIIKGGGDFKLKQVDFSSLKNWQNDDHSQALRAFIQSCNKFAKMSQSRSIGNQVGKITAGDFHDVCDIAQAVKTMSSRQAQNFFENWFRPFLVEKSYGNSEGVFTGYYEAALKGSKVKTEKFKYPVYGKPQDLTGDPYFTRAEIEEGALKSKNLELLYVDDKVELFFLHIQGSGRVEMPDGSIVRLSYAARNSHKFNAIANYMSQKGYLEQGKINAATAKDWLKKNPDKADEVMNLNPAYTFFVISDNEYVIGAQGVPLTPERSLAVDREIIPFGFPIWLETKLKKKDGTKETYDHLFVSQDTGSAIKGAVRGDIFFGYGEKQEEKAYYMASRGKYYILLPINVVDKIGGDQ